MLSKLRDKNSHLILKIQILVSVDISKLKITECCTGRELRDAVAQPTHFADEKTNTQRWSNGLGV